ncbi:MAG TPA: DUF305 domain-containing protein [Cyclobacteriaceae bacterium]|nr:DUF305 domain-containing protein [Cyclobacteriaceae bacterium]
MKTKTTFIAGIALIAALASVYAFSPNDFNGAITRMIEKIRSIKMTGNPDSDFAHVMAEHNQGAIDLANIELRSGKDVAVKSIARNVLTKQQKMQEEVRKHIKKGEPAVTASTPAQQVANQSPMEDNVKDILADIEKWMKKTPMTGDPDKDFVEAMLQHYKDEVKIANMEMRHGKDQAVKDFATKAKNDSQSIEKEIADWRNAHLK